MDFKLFLIFLTNLKLVFIKKKTNPQQNQNSVVGVN